MMKKWGSKIRQGFLAQAIISLIFSISVFASDRKIAVSGQCSRSTTPDRAEIQAVASFRNLDMKSAIRDATQAYENALRAVKKLNLADLEVETSEYNVHDIREWEKNRQVFKGYEARIGLKVSTSSVGQLGQVMSEAAQSGLKDVGQLRMFLSETKLTSEKSLCLKIAAEHAQGKAKELASALGAKVGKVFSVQEEGSKVEPIRPLDGMMMSSDVSAKRMIPASIESGKQQVMTSVNVVFELE
jgi:uncharacterized protein YggE